MVQGLGNNPKTKEYGQEQQTKSKINIKNRNPVTKGKKSKT